jgi:uncharacterized protein YcnI
MSRLARVTSALLAATAVVIAPTAAFAHVEVEVDGTAVQGGYATLVFTIPNERADSATTMIQIKMPDDTPIAFVIPEPANGWEPSATQRTLSAPLQLGAASETSAADVVTWTATAGGLTGDSAVELRMQVGPFPLDATELSFPTVQTYASGEVVRWIEPELADGSEPELPLPVVALSPGTGSYGEVPPEFASLLPTVDPAPTSIAPPPEQSIVVDPDATETDATETEATETATIAPPAAEQSVVDDPTGQTLVVVPADDATETSDGNRDSSAVPIIGGVVAAAAVVTYFARKRKAAR